MLAANQIRFNMIAGTLAGALALRGCEFFKFVDVALPSCRKATEGIEIHLGSGFQQDHSTSH